MRSVASVVARAAARQSRLPGVAAASSRWSDLASLPARRNIVSVAGVDRSDVWRMGSGGRRMCTAPTDTGEGEIAEMSVWDMEDEETGEIIEDAVLRIGPDGVEVQVDGDTTIEWSDLKVTNVKPGPDGDTEIISVQTADGEAFVFETDKGGSKKLKKGSASGPNGASSSVSASAGEAVSGWQPTPTLPAAEWEDLTPGQCLTQLQFMGRGGNLPSIRHVNRLLLNCQNEIANGGGDSEHALKIAIKGLEEARRNLIVPNNRTVHLFLQCCKAHGDLATAIAVLAPSPPIRILNALKPAKVPKEPTSASEGEEATAEGEEAEEEEATEEEEEEEEEEEKNTVDESALVTRAMGSSLEVSPIMSASSRRELMTWAASSGSYESALRVLGSAEAQASKAHGTAVDNRLVHGALRACVDAGETKKALLLAEHYTLLGWMLGQGTLAQWPANWNQHQKARRMMHSGLGEGSTDVSKSAIRIATINHVIRGVTDTSAAPVASSGEEGDDEVAEAVEGGLPVYGEEEDLELLRRLISLSGSNANDTTNTLLG